MSVITEPKNASLHARRLCVEWLTACIELGWKEEQLPDLEAMFWKYRDHRTGEFKTKPNEEQ